MEGWYVILSGIGGVLVTGIAFCVKNKCKHSKYELNSGCFKMSASEDERERSLKTMREQIKIIIRELQSSSSSDQSGIYSSPISASGRARASSV